MKDLPAEYTHHVFGPSEVIVGMDLGEPGSGKPAETFIRAWYDRQQVMIIDDPLNDEPVTEAQKAKFLEWFEANLKGRYEEALAKSFAIPPPRESYLTSGILQELMRKAPPKDRGTYLDQLPRAGAVSPWYRQSDRQLNGRRR